MDKATSDVILTILTEDEAKNTEAYAAVCDVDSPESRWYHLIIIVMNTLLRTDACRLMIQLKGAQQLEDSLIVQHFFHHGTRRMCLSSLVHD